MNPNNNTATATADPASNGMTTRSASMEPEILSVCSKCGRDVPTANLVLHEATCSRARSRVSASASNQQQNDNSISTSRAQNQQQEQQTEEEIMPEPSAPLLPTERERGQQTLDRWLSSASTSSSSSNSNRAGASSSRNNAASSSNSNSNTTNNASSSLTTHSYAGSRASFSANSNTATAPGVEPAARGATSVSGRLPLGMASFIGNVRPPETAQTQSATAAQTSAASSANTNNENVQLREGQWQCPRCTLVNDAHSSRCNACLAPSPNRPPDASGNDRLVQENIYNDWVNVTYNPQFRRGRNGIRRIPPRNQPRFSVQLPQNPLVHNTGAVGTAARVFNGLVNGAVVGSVFAGVGGMIVGGLAGAAGGAMVDRARNRAEQTETNQTREVADMLAGDGGGIEPGSVRVHRGDGHITALASDSGGRNRVIRVRYGDGALEARQLRIEQSNNLGDGALRQQVEGARDDLERSLLEILVQMSYSRDFGPGPGSNVILQPEESFDELIQRFGLGNDNRGASPEVIDSYPVEVVRKAVHGDDDDSYSGSGSESNYDESSQESEGNQEGKSPETDDDDDEESSCGSMDTDGTSELGTCGICLEDYKEGDVIKKLACPHRPHCFHKECIDKWLKLVASCPICKNDVRMYKPPVGGD